VVCVVAPTRIELSYCLDDRALSTAVFTNEKGYSCWNVETTFPNQLRYRGDRERPLGDVRRTPWVRTPIDTFEVSRSHEQVSQVLGCAEVLISATWLCLQNVSGFSGEAERERGFVRCKPMLGGAYSGWDGAGSRPVS
jgi:hypothetical protein